MAKTAGTEGEFEDVLYFNSTKSYTTALLDAFNNVKFWVRNGKTPNTQKEYIVPISFGNYEKSQVLGDLSEEDIQRNNYNHLPRLVLSFVGMTKNTERQTQKYNQFKQFEVKHKHSTQNIQASYNSLSYDFNFTLLLQTRGLTQSSQITEEILSHFNPTMNLNIKEFPLIDETETQIQISDPSFEIPDSFEREDTNLINVTFDITIRGNIYSKIDLKGKIETIKLINHIWDLKEIQNSKMASLYNFDISDTERTGKILQQERHFNGVRESVTIGDNIYDIEGLEADILDKDYSPSQIDTEYETDFYELKQEN